MNGPLTGVKVLEIGGIGPVPFAAMVLADLGATVLRVDRPGAAGVFDGDGASAVVNRGRAIFPANLKDPSDRDTTAELAARADILIEGFRPGVMERLGLGPDVLLRRNPRLVYGRMTGYGQEGPLATAAGHDINYIATAGVLGAMARQGGRPMFPLNLVGDYGGGGMLLVVGVLAALTSARETGRGQVVDAAMVDGASLLAAAIHGLMASGVWREPPGVNVLDSGAPFYEVYRCADGGHMAVGAIEPEFYAALLDVLGVPADEAPQWDRSRWPELKRRFTGVFSERSRDEWTAAFEAADACVTPVLGLGEAPEHPHARARGAFVEANGVLQPAPAPRFSATPTAIHVSPSLAETLRCFGLQEGTIGNLTAARSAA